MYIHIIKNWCKLGEIDIQSSIHDLMLLKYFEKGSKPPTYPIRGVTKEANFYYKKNAFPQVTLTGFRKILFIIIPRVVFINTSLFLR